MKLTRLQKTAVFVSGIYLFLIFLFALNVNEGWDGKFYFISFFSGMGVGIFPLLIGWGIYWIFKDTLKINRSLNSLVFRSNKLNKYGKFVLFISLTILNLVIFYKYSSPHYYKPTLKDVENIDKEEVKKKQEIINSLSSSQITALAIQRGILIPKKIE